MSTLTDFVGAPDEGCRCTVAFEEGRLLVDADECSYDGRLADSEECRATVVDALSRRDAEAVTVAAAGAERTYDEESVALLLSAGRFVEAVLAHDEYLATTTRRDPLAGAREATTRPGPVADLAAETGLAAVAERLGVTDPADEVDYGDALTATTTPAVARMRVRQSPPSGAELLDARELDTGAMARTYRVGEARRYYLHPPELDLSPRALSTLSAAESRLANGTGTGRDDRAVERAVRAVAADADDVRLLVRALGKHTRGYGVLTDFFADERVSDVYATAPVGRTPLRAVVDGCELPTNVTLTRDGAEALASQLRRESGRAFSRANPSLDATASLPSGPVRVAGVTDPVSDGVAFAFRDQGDRTWTLPALVENGTMTPRSAGFLSVAVARDASVLLAGARGTGKTTTLGALLWELPVDERTLVVEDTPELPVSTLRERGRDVQALRTSTDDDAPGVTPVEALRTALRLGNSALVVGEVRGEEAGVLYEAMRVGASDDAVLGTIHGDGAAGVRDRVTADLGVPASSFAETDVVVTLSTVERGGSRSRVVGAVEEVIPTEDGVEFGTLFEYDGDRTASTGRVDRGGSHAIADLAAPGESYADVREAVESRATAIADLVDRDRTRPGTFPASYLRRRGSNT